MKVNAARSKIASITSLVLLTSLFVSIPVTAQAAACNPTSTTVGGDTVLTFSTVGNCDWTVPAGVTSVRLLVVGGGGSGSAGISSIYWPAGGGGGAVIANSSISVTPGNSVTISVGAGGAATAATSGAVGNNGGSSAFGSTTASGGSTNSNVATNNAGRIGGTSGNGNNGGTGTSSGSSCDSGSCGTGGGGGAGGNGGVVTGITDEEMVALASIQIFQGALLDMAAVGQAEMAHQETHHMEVLLVITHLLHLVQQEMVPRIPVAVDLERQMVTAVLEDQA
jgi:hypothetical protein